VRAREIEFRRFYTIGICFEAEFVTGLWAAAVRSLLSRAVDVVEAINFYTTFEIPKMISRVRALGIV
jgi:hypothetical protein